MIDRTASFDDYYPCCSNKKWEIVDLEHVYNGIKLFIYVYNTTIRNKISFVNRG